MGYTATHSWLEALSAVLQRGYAVRPRGQTTLELPHYALKPIDMNHPAIAVTARKANYRFMAAEAYWIIIGDDSVAGIAPYNSVMAKFSDDGERLAGAYGVPFNEQVGYVCDALERDPDTRQATMTFWRPSPKPSKDIPCTVALDFKIRGDKLNLHAFMRSSDQWLGLPYDIFSFSLIAAAVCSAANAAHIDLLSPLTLGNLYLTAASSHLYEQHCEAARRIVADYEALVVDEWAKANPSATWRLPAEFYDGSLPRRTAWLERLAALRDGPQPFIGQGAASQADGS